MTTILESPPQVTAITGAGPEADRSLAHPATSAEQRRFTAAIVVAVVALVAALTRWRSPSVRTTDHAAPPSTPAAAFPFDAYGPGSSTYAEQVPALVSAAAATPRATPRCSPRYGPAPRCTPSRSRPSPRTHRVVRHVERRYAERSRPWPTARRRPAYSREHRTPSRSRRPTATRGRVRTDDPTRRARFRRRTEHRRRSSTGASREGRCQPQRPLPPWSSRRPGAGGVDRSARAPRARMVTCSSIATAELAVLGGVLEDAYRARPSALLLVGDAGVGQVRAARRGRPAGRPAAARGSSRSTPSSPSAPSPGAAASSSWPPSSDVVDALDPARRRRACAATRAASWTACCPGAAAGAAREPRPRRRRWCCSPTTRSGGTRSRSRPWSSPPDASRPTTSLVRRRRSHRPRADLPALHGAPPARPSPRCRATRPRPWCAAQRHGHASPRSPRRSSTALGGQSRSRCSTAVAALPERVRSGHGAVARPGAGRARPQRALGRRCCSTLPDRTRTRARRPRGRRLRRRRRRSTRPGRSLGCSGDDLVPAEALPRGRCSGRAAGRSRTPSCGRRSSRRSTPPERRRRARRPRRGAAAPRPRRALRPATSPRRASAPDEAVGRGARCRSPTRWPTPARSSRRPRAPSTPRG